MVFFNYALRKLNAKIVYYGPGLCGKTTNLQWIHDHFEGGEKGKMVSLATEGDRTIFFDLLPLEIGRIRGMDVTLQLYTVPGQVHYNSTRQLVLRGADGVVFVADSQKTMRGSNVDSLGNLAENLSLQGIKLDEFPHVLQFNKRDLGDLMSVDEMDAGLNRNDAPFFDAVAIEGIGVQETLEGIVKLVMRSLKERYEARAPEMRPAPPPSPPKGGAAPWPVIPPLAPAPAPVSASPLNQEPFARDESLRPPQPTFEGEGRHDVEPPVRSASVAVENGDEDEQPPEEVDTHTDILFPHDDDSIDELEYDLESEEAEQGADLDIDEPGEEPVFPQPFWAPPAEGQGEPLETGDDSNMSMPFETIDIGTLPAEDADPPKLDSADGVADHEGGDQIGFDDNRRGQGGGERRSDSDTWSDRPHPAVSPGRGVDDLVASILGRPSARAPAQANTTPVPEPAEGAAQPDEVSQPVFGEVDSDAFPEMQDSSSAAAEKDEVVASTAPISRGLPGAAPVQFVLDDGDPFGGDGWDLPPAPAPPPSELLPALDERDHDDSAGSTPVQVSVEDNSLALKLTGTGAIVERGQVRAIDIEVPVPGSWVGNNRVTMQLRLTLVPAPEDEDA